MTRTTMFAPLFEPLQLGAATARNRIMHAPMSVCYGDEAGFVTRPEVEHYARRARGGAGTVITENFAVSESGRQMPKQTVVSLDAHVAGLTELAGAVKAHGALAMVQLVHAGRYAGPWDVYHEARRLAPSAVPFELTAGRIVTPQEITPEEIAGAIEEFGRAAELCERAGFDGVDVHGAQGFLISEFLSPLRTGAPTSGAAASTTGCASPWRSSARCGAARRRGSSSASTCSAMSSSTAAGR